MLVYQRVFSQKVVPLFIFCRSGKESEIGRLTCAEAPTLADTNVSGCSELGKAVVWQVGYGTLPGGFTFLSADQIEP